MEQNTSAPSAPRRRSDFVDRAGQRFGKLVAVKVADTRSSSGDICWVCLCDCGNETIVRTASLGRGKTRSCGCLKRLEPGRSTRNQVCKDYRKSARLRGYSWDLTDDDFDRLVSQPCFYCGLAPSMVRTHKNLHPFVCGGIDRKDNSVGYTVGNTVSCCTTCNLAKKAMPYEEWTAWIARLTAHQFFRPDVTPSRLLGNVSRVA